MTFTPVRLLFQSLAVHLVNKYILNTILFLSVTYWCQNCHIVRLEHYLLHNLWLRVAVYTGTAIRRPGPFHFHQIHFHQFHLSYIGDPGFFVIRSPLWGFFAFVDRNESSPESSMTEFWNWRKTRLDCSKQNLWYSCLPLPTCRVLDLSQTQSCLHIK